MRDALFDDFAKGLRGGDASLTGLDAENRRRFAVYANAVAKNGIEALRSAFPAVDRIVGPNFFSPMAHAFWKSQPPRERTLTLYGAGFPEFIASWPSASGLPYLPDIARLDRAWLEVLYAADDPVLRPERVARLDPGLLPGLRPRLHSAVRRLRLAHPVLDLWRAQRFDAEPGPMRVGLGESDVLVWRGPSGVQADMMTPGRRAFFDALAEGNTIAGASAAACATEPGLDPAGEFGFALGAGLLCDPESRLSPREPSS